jgi:conjugal transfer pilus assembly protein TraU
MSLWKKLIAAATLLVASTAQAVVPTMCTGRLFNPLTDADWNNIFPITIAGVPLGAGTNPMNPLMAAMPPVCVCPTILGIPFVGIGVTYWQPTYLAEIEHRPGCLSSLGGINVLPGYSMLQSEQTVNHENRGKSTNRMQVHFYTYPLFGMLEMMKSVSCNNPSGFNLGYVTEVDPLWQDDLWGAVFAPESAVFANPIAQMACAVDAVSASAGYPQDALFWCSGSMGGVYPLTGNSQHSGDPFTLNNQVMSKFLARHHRMGLQWQTIGPTAICSSHPNPVWVKSQYRFNQVAPIPRKGRAVAPGDNGKLFQFPPVTNLPTQEQTVNLIWQGQQCCLKPIP